MQRTPLLAAMATHHQFLVLLLAAAVAVARVTHPDLALVDQD